jgi:hypothetical protein
MKISSFNVSKGSNQNVYRYRLWLPLTSATSLYLYGRGS